VDSKCLGYTRERWCGIFLTPCLWGCGKLWHRTGCFALRFRKAITTGDPR